MVDANDSTEVSVGFIAALTGSGNWVLLLICVFGLGALLAQMVGWWLTQKLEHRDRRAAHRRERWLRCADRSAVFVIDGLPLLGILGTVLAMQNSFGLVAEGATADVARSFAPAFTTTFWALLFALLNMGTYHLLFHPHIQPMLRHTRSEDGA